MSIGVLLTWLIGAGAAAWLLDLPQPAALTLGAILVVSGPTVVGPLLDYIRPGERLRRALTWEGSLIDPIGATLAAIVFNAVTASRHERVAAQLGQFLGSIGVGLLGGAVGAAGLWLLLRAFGANGPLLLALAQLGCVVGVAAVCDALRDDSGLTAAIVMGLAVGNLPHFRLPERQPFFETLVRLVIGVLFVSISATVTPLSVRHRLRPALGVAAILVFVARPLVAWLYTLRSDLTGPERAYVGWMAPRGIVAAATATTFGSGLMAAGAVGADKILPATFVVIVATVTLYGLTAAPVARWLDVVRTSRTRPLLVGGHPWVVALGTALRTVGLDVLMWAGTDADRRRIEQAGLELAAGDMVAAATGEGAELEGVTAVLLLTDEDDFNALASTVLAATTEGPVYRLAPPSSAHGVVAPYTSADPLFGAGLTRAEVTRRFDAGAPIVRLPAGEPVPVGHHPLLKVDRAGRLRSVTAADPASGDPGAVLLLLGSSSPVAGDARPPAPRRP
ncbi:MAG TPA: cation:proton antiporter [Asanoa sp.]